MQDELQGIVGTALPLKVGERVLEQFPIKIKDWPEFSQVYFILKLETLQEVFVYGDALDLLRKCMSLTSRKEEVDVMEFLNDMNQSDYARYRDMILDMNDIVFKEEAKGDSKKE